MKSVMLSIQPKWCELIASGKKTVEVRKTRPKIETPFKCYIYCTHNNRKYALHTYINSGYGRKNFGVIGNWRSGKDVVDVNSHLPAYRYNAYLAEGKVIGEFVCDEIFEIEYKCGGYRCKGLTVRENDRVVSASKLSLYDMRNYLSCNNGYAWHISDLVIYDKPKELSEFCKPTMPTGLRYENDTITRPPQSWCYVEEREENGTAQIQPDSDCGKEQGN